MLLLPWLFISTHTFGKEMSPIVSYFLNALSLLYIEYQSQYVVVHIVEDNFSSFESNESFLIIKTNLLWKQYRLPPHKGGPIKKIVNVEQKKEMVKLYTSIYVCMILYVVYYASIIIEDLLLFCRFLHCLTAHILVQALHCCGVVVVVETQQFPAIYTCCDFIKKITRISI